MSEPRRSVSFVRTEIGIAHNLLIFGRSVFEMFERLSPSLGGLGTMPFKRLCAFSDSAAACSAINDFLAGCCVSSPGDDMPSDCAFVYLSALRAASSPARFFKRARGVDEVELTRAAQGMVRGFSDLLEGARRGGWASFQDADPAVRARASDRFIGFLWLYLDYVERRKVLGRRRTLAAVCVIHNARLLSLGEPEALRRCEKARRSLMPCFLKVGLEADVAIFRRASEGSSAPIPGYPGDPSLTSVAIRPFGGDRALSLARLAYELVVDPAYRARVPSDYFDLFDECSFFTVDADLAGTPPAVDYLMDMVDALSARIGELGGLPALAPELLPDESALVRAFEARAPLAPLLQPLFDALVAMCVPPHFFTPAVPVSAAELLFVRLADCGGALLLPRHAFVDRLTAMRCDWVQLTAPFPAPHTPAAAASLWVRTLRYLMWVRTSLEVEASHVRIGLLTPIIDQKTPELLGFIHDALFAECASAESVAGFTVWLAGFTRPPGGGAPRSGSLEDGFRQAVVDVAVGLADARGAVLFPSSPPRVPLEGVPLTLRFDWDRLSRICSRVGSAVAVVALLRTVELALAAGCPVSAPARLHACYLGIFWC